MPFNNEVVYNSTFVKF